MSIQDKQMLNDLVVESRDHLASVEPDLLELEQKGAAVSDELINRVFRAVHSIKGGFGFFGVEQVTKLSHVMENALSKVRDKALAVTSELVDALLVGVDKLRLLLDHIEGADRIPINDELARLTPFIEGKTAVVIPAHKTITLELDRSIRQKHKDLSDDRIVNAIKNGKLLYIVTLNARKDIEDKKLTPIALFQAWETIGEILDIALDFDDITGLAGSTSHELKYSVVFASVLDSDLISAGIDMPADQIHAFDTSAVRAQITGSKQTAAAKPESPAAISGPGPNPLSAPETVTKHSDTRTEDALRVKVDLLNKLMNLAGELVLSRNQLLQGMNRTISESIESDRIFKEFDRQVKRSCNRVGESITREPHAVKTIMTAETERLQKLFRQSIGFKMAELPGLRAVMQNLDMVTSMLQESIMQTRLQPITVLLSKFPRIIRDFAKKLDKEVELTLVGQDVELDKSIIELLSDPLTHLIRNSVDHGIEMPDRRAAAGKKKAGQVVLRAFHEGGKVNIQIRDDGGGIDTARVRAKAIEKKLITAEAAAKLSDIEINRFIMSAGFSTAEKVTAVSGRGVGMDVVKTNIEKLGGTIDVSSIFGCGTSITMQLPLTLAIISSLVVTAEGRRFAIPQVGIEKLVRIHAKDITKKIERVGRSEVYRLRGRLLPLVRLAQVLRLQPTFVDPETGERKINKRSRWSDRRKTGKNENETDAKEKNEGTSERREHGPDRRSNVHNAVKLVVLRAGENRFGLVVDDVFDSEEIVVKPLSSYLKSIGCYAGSTIMGDGSVAMILDPNGLSRLAELKFEELEKANEAEHERMDAEHGKIFQDILLFDNGSDERLGVELSRIARIEKIENDRIERIGSREFVRYSENTLPLIRLQDYLSVAPTAQRKSFQFVIVPKADTNPIGIAIERVHDVVHAEIKLDTGGIKGKGIIGSMVMNSRMTLLVDIQEILEKARQQLA
jgi:two-component system chemotaxis sensor kinase CheA